MKVHFSYKTAAAPVGQSETIPLFIRDWSLCLTVKTKSYMPLEMEDTPIFISHFLSILIRIRGIVVVPLDERLT